MKNLKLMMMIVGILTTAACGTDADEKSSVTKAELQQSVDSWSIDHCEEEGWYADGVCDTFCPIPDQDCELEQCADDCVTTAEARICDDGSTGERKCQVGTCNVAHVCEEDSNNDVCTTPASIEFCPDGSESPGWVCNDDCECQPDCPGDGGDCAVPASIEICADGTESPGWICNDACECQPDCGQGEDCAVPASIEICPDGTESPGWICNDACECQPEC